VIRLPHFGIEEKMIKLFCTSALILLLVQADTASKDSPQDTRSQDTQSTSLINIRVSRTTEAVNYRDKTSTKIDFRGTPLMARVEGKAEIEAKNGRIAIKAEFTDLQPASTFGSAYLTYVLWAISPEGSPNNLGEIILDGSKSKLEVTTNLQTFAMIVTAEPYFAVSFPSEVVVVENVVRSDTKGSVSTVNARFDLLQRGTYDNMRLERYITDSKVPLSLYEARNAVRIAKAQGARHYAAESWAKAEDALRRAEDYQLRKQHKSVATAARDAVQAAEDARTIAVRRQEDERVTEQQRAADAAARRARAEQEEEAQRRSDAERQRMQAEVAAAQEAKARAEADAQRQAAMLQEQQARDQAAQSAQEAALASRQAQDAQAQAQQAQQLAAQSERDKQELRAKLLQQFNRILETRDTVRGLVVNIGDVLFDTGKYTLRMPAREALAKLSGIVLAYPGLRLQVEGHTDSTGSHVFNQKLSEQRATTVRDYLVQQGVDMNAVSAAGFGEGVPIADNTTSVGRQKNRRVEIIVSGEVIGTQIGAQPQPVPQQ
jgi:outer membrane protein OmpA-like peptidoglycan-associated protein